MIDRRNERDRRPGSGPVGGPREARNTLCLELYQVVVRVGWIFKTETIIMPAVLDAVVDSGLLRGLLPVLNRGGQSVPPLFVAGGLARLPRKKWALVLTSLAMASCFGVLAVAWKPLAAARPDLLAVLFLVLYALFSAANGLNQVVLAALQGKLISPGRRGRAMVVSVALGSVLAIIAAVVLLGPRPTASRRSSPPLRPSSHWPGSRPFFLMSRPRVGCATRSRQRRLRSQPSSFLAPRRAARAVCCELLREGSTRGGARCATTRS